MENHQIAPFCAAQIAFLQRQNALIRVRAAHLWLHGESTLQASDSVAAIPKVKVDLSDKNPGIPCRWGRSVEMHRIQPQRVIFFVLRQQRARLRYDGVLGSLFPSDGMKVNCCIIT